MNSTVDPLSSRVAELDSKNDQMVRAVDQFQGSNTNSCACLFTTLNEINKTSPVNPLFAINFSTYAISHGTGMLVQHRIHEAMQKLNVYLTHQFTYLEPMLLLGSYLNVQVRVLYSSMRKSFE